MLTALGVGLFFFHRTDRDQLVTTGHIFLTHYQRTLPKDLRKTPSAHSAICFKCLANSRCHHLVVFCFVAIIGSTEARELLAPLFASAGIGVALGWRAVASQDFLSGIFIISENQYRVGDIIEIEGFGGTVERIGVRSTVIRDADGNVHYFQTAWWHVINKTMGYSMARFTLSVAQNTDLERVEKIINKIGLELAAEDD